MPKRRKSVEPEAPPAGEPVYGIPIRNSAYCAKIEDHLVTIYQGDRIDQHEKCLGLLAFIYPGSAPTPGVTAQKWKTVLQTVLEDGMLLQQIFTHMTKREKP